MNKVILILILSITLLLFCSCKGQSLNKDESNSSESEYTVATDDGILTDANKGSRITNAVDAEQNTIDLTTQYNNASNQVKQAVNNGSTAVSENTISTVQTPQTTELSESTIETTETTDDTTTVKQFQDNKGWSDFR